MPPISKGLVRRTIGRLRFVGKYFQIPTLKVAYMNFFKKKKKLNE